MNYKFFLQNRSLRNTLLGSYCLVLFILILIFLIARKYDIPVANFTGDPALITDVPFYIGFLSNIGVIFWSLTCSICLFTWIILNKINKKETSSFFLFSGLFTLFLLLDDLFMIHDQIFPRYFLLSQKIVYLIYFILTLVFFFKYGKYIFLKTEKLLLFSAFAFFALSILFDMFMPQSHTSINYLIEDGLKLFGIITWFIFFSRSSYKQLVTQYS